MAPKKTKQKSQQSGQTQGQQQKTPQTQSIQQTQKIPQTRPKQKSQEKPQDEKQQTRPKQQSQKQQKQQKRKPNQQEQRKQTSETQPYSMRPDQHQHVMRHLKDTGLTFNFQPIDDNTTKIEEHDTGIMGSFICHNKECRSSGWGSKSISTTIRLYPDSSYNARIYHQRCKKCNELSRPKVTHDSYAERVAHWLKIWSGVDVERRPFSGRSAIPHKSELCEGCKLGHCKHAKNVEIESVTVE
ncbi:hypothetical protein Q7P37_007420 [Cladosporium fusiforme]